MSNLQKKFPKVFEFFDNNEFAATTYLNKYALKDKDGNIVEDDPNKTIYRVCKVLSDSMPTECPSEEWLKKNFKEEYNPEKKYIWLDIFIKAVNGFRGVIPQGGVLSAAGNLEFPQSLSNCFVIEAPHDSISGIMRANEKMASIYKRRGGCGTNLSSLRPENALVKNAANKSTGAWGWANHFSNTCRDVAMLGRRGALMLTLDVKHPDAEKWATMKNDLKYCTGANVSLQISDEFMNAVIKDKNFTQQFPTDSDEPTVTKKIKAKDLWKIICESAWKTGEPGLIFWDQCLRNLPAECYEGFKSISVNPCSEILLSNDSCRLAAICLTNYVENKFKDGCYFNFDRFVVDVRVGMRMMDALVSAEIKQIDRIIEKIKLDIVDAETEDLFRSEIALWENFKKAGELGRRTGLGLFGLGDCLTQLRIKYDSDEALEVINNIFKCFRDIAYSESVEMAKEYGPFPVFDWEKEKNCEFIKRLPDDIKEGMQKYGRRNISLLTCSPTGTLSIIARCSSGIEPLFRLMYLRRRKINSNDLDIKVDFVDELGDKWSHHPQLETIVKQYLDSAGIELPKNIKNDEDLLEYLPKYFTTSDKINWKRKIEILGKMITYIDHSISNCVVGDTYIQTNKGIKQISMMGNSPSQNNKFSSVNNDYYVVNSENKSVKCDQFFTNGVAECLKITFSNNSSDELICTPNHKLLVLSEDYKPVWKPAVDLSDKDWVIGRLGLECFGNNRKSISAVMGKFNSSLLTNKPKRNLKDIKIPKYMTRKLARLLGYLISDGSVHTNGISLSQTKNNVCDDFKQLIKDIFGIGCSVSRDKRSKNLFCISANSRVLRDFIEYLGIGRDCSKKYIPQIIFECAGRLEVAEFIRGLTLDGHISRHQVCVMTTTSRRLAKELCLLLNQFGIESNLCIKPSRKNVKMPHGTITKRTKEAYCVYCSKESGSMFVDFIGFAEDRKKKESKRKFKRSTRKVLLNQCPDYGLRKRVREELLKKQFKSARLYNLIHSLTCKDKIGRTIPRDNLLLFSDLGVSIPTNLLDPTYRFLKVNKIVSIGLQNVFDLSVSDGHSYIANNIISHNTTNLPNSAKPELIEELYELAWKEGLKGLTVYRDGSRSGVLVSNEELNKKESKDILDRKEAPKRPEKLPCDVYVTSVKNTEYVVIVGLYNNSVYEVFAGEYNNQIPKKPFSGFVEKKGKSKYILNYIEDTEFKQIDINKYFDNKNYAAATRLLSMSLRHQTPLGYIIDQLQKAGSNMFEYGPGLARILKKYVKIEDMKRVYNKCNNCGSTDVVLTMESGCYTLKCNSCHTVDSKCS